MNTNTISQKDTLQIPITSRAYAGVVSGLVGGFVIFFVVFIIDFHLDQIPGTFYKIIGFPIGLEGISATLFGMTSHMITAVLIGIVFCICSGLHQKLELNNNITKGMFAGGTTGIVVYFLFFIPITMLVIQPLIEQGMHNDSDLITTISNIESVHLIQNMTLILSGALIIHVLFGAIMGFTATLSIGEQKSKINLHKGKTMKRITLAIIAGTVVIGIFYGMVANQTSTLSSIVQQNELSEELSKIETGLTYAKFINMSEDRRLTILTQMSTHTKGLILNEAKKFDKMINEDMSEITNNLESVSDLKFLQSAQITGVKGNDAEGKAVTVSNGHTTYLRLEDFLVTNGIDQHVYLTKDGDIIHGIDVGKLKGNKGNQNYLIHEIDPNEYNQIIIYSKLFDIYYASASLTRIGSN